MKKFKFKLQKLLDMKKALEKEIHSELSSLITIQNTERQKQDQYQRSIYKEQKIFSNKLRSGDYSYTELINYQRYIDFAAKIIDSSDEKIQSMEPEIQKVKDKLIEASKKRKLVESIREKRWKQYLYELNREINKENDDSNQNKFIRKRIEDLN